ncbi:MAG: hypothetical protein MUO63_11205, partial [Desulfobulbaceae bacterium]|nr:hypothetical protein [Desulfobulbaceae bacterium]
MSAEKTRGCEDNCRYKTKKADPGGTGPAFFWRKEIRVVILICGISNGRAKQLRKKHFRLIPYAIRKKHFPRKLNPRSKNTIFYTLAL